MKYNNKNNIHSIGDCTPSNDEEELCPVIIEIPSYLIRLLHECACEKYGGPRFCNGIIVNALNDFLNNNRQHHVTSLLYDGGKPRRDVLVKLNKIGNNFRDLQSYPKISLYTMEPAIKKEIGKDHRTFKKYKKCVMMASEIERNASSIGRIYDVGRFRELVAEELSKN